jgi:chromosome segregation ATPase
MEAAAQMIDELKDQLRKCTAASDEYCRQIHVLRARLDEASQEQSKLEVQLHERDAKIATLEAARRELARQRRDAEQAADAEMQSALRDREEMLEQEQALRSVIQRLKESLAQQKTARSSVDLDEANSGSFYYNLFLSVLQGSLSFFLLAATSLVVEEK